MAKDRSSPSPSSSDPHVDGGWAWVIAFALAGMYAINAGTFKSYGIINLRMKEAYPTCHRDVPLWIFNSAATLSLLIGPVVSIAQKKWSSRRVGVLASLLFAGGLMLTATISSCYLLFFSFSVVYGIGTGTVLLICWTSFAPYFSKYRGLAAGIVASGSGLGGGLLPVLSAFLLEEFNFQQSMCIYGSVCLNLLVFTSLLRPPNFYRHQHRGNGKDSKTAAAISSDTDATPVEKGDTSSIINSGTQPKNDQEHLKEEKTETLELKKPLRFSSEASASAAESHLEDASLDLAEDFQTTDTTTAENKEDRSDHNTKRMIWLRPTVILPGLIILCGITANCILVTTTPSLSEEYSVDLKTTSVIISVTSASEVAFRIMNGHIADKKCSSTIFQMSLVLLITGGSAAVAAIIPNIIGICTVYTVNAIFGSSMFSLLPIVNIELNGEERLAEVTGFMNVYQAAGFLISAPIANGLFDAFGSWKYAMWAVSAFYLTSGLLGFLYILINGLIHCEGRNK